MFESDPEVIELSRAGTDLCHKTQTSTLFFGRSLPNYLHTALEAVHVLYSAKVQALSLSGK